MEKLKNTMTIPKVSVKDGRATTTSLQVAEYFGKQHKNVLRTIETMECSSEFKGLNFEPFKYKGRQGREYTAYTMTKNGFTFLVFGFTGKIADKFKEAYINAFDEMQAKITSGSTDALPPPDTEIGKGALRIEPKLYTVAGWAKCAGVKITQATSNSMSRQAGKYSRDHGLPIGREYIGGRHPYLNKYVPEVLKMILCNDKIVEDWDKIK